MALRNFQVVSCKPNSKGGFLTKIQIKDTTVIRQGIFGTNMAQKSETYYVFGSNMMQAGQQVPVDTDLYHIRTRDYAIPSTGEVIELKYLAGLK